MYTGADKRCFGEGLLSSLQALRGRVRADKRVRRCSSSEHSSPCRGSRAFYHRLLTRKARGTEEDALEA